MPRGGRGARERRGRPPDGALLVLPEGASPAAGGGRGGEGGGGGRRMRRGRAARGVGDVLRVGRRRSRAAARTGVRAAAGACATSPGGGSPHCGPPRRRRRPRARRRVGGEGRQRVVARADGARVPSAGEAPGGGGVVLFGVQAGAVANDASDS